MTLTALVVVLISVSLGLPEPEFAGLLIPATRALFQANVVPAVPLVGLYENDVLLQIDGGVNVLLRNGIGFTLTTTF
jgi:hypothetical protein